MEKNDSKNSITLQQFLKKNNIVFSGGEAKYLIQGGDVKVNDIVVTERGKKLHKNDVIEVDKNKYVVEE